MVAQSLPGCHRKCVHPAGHTGSLLGERSADTGARYLQRELVILHTIYKQYNLTLFGQI